MAYAEGKFPLYPVDVPPYTIEVPGAQPVPGESLPRRHPKARNGLLERPAPGINNVFDLISYSATKYGGEPAMASRRLIDIHTEVKKVTKIVDGHPQEVDKKWEFLELSDYSSLTFGEYFRLLRQLGCGLRNLGLAHGDKLHVFASTSRQWLSMAHACASQSLPIVTAYDTLGESGLQHSLKQTGAVAMFTDPHLLPTVSSSLKAADSIRYVIYNDASHQRVEPGAIDAFRAKHPELKVLSFEELRALGEGDDGEPTSPPDPPSPDDIFCIMYTSGSTGLPKGVPVTHAGFVAAVAGLYFVLEGCVTHHDRILAYLPLAHILELVVENVVVFVGGSLGYGSPRSLTDLSMKKGCPSDLRAFRPTVLVGVPQVWESVRKGVNSGVENAGVVGKFLFSSHLALKGYLTSAGLLRGPVAALLSLVDNVVFARVQKTTGGKLRFIVNGASGISADTQRFLSLVVAPMINGYGLTETCGNGGLGSPLQYTETSLGTVPPSIEAKLVSHLDLGYDANPDPGSGKDPHGEILLRGRPILREYYNNPEETAQVLTADGWFRTGDVGAFDLKTGHIRVVDRLKNLVKMQGGEYIALEKLEAIYRGASAVQSLMVYGDSEHARPVAIVSVNEKALQALADKNNISSNSSPLHENPQVHRLMLKEMLSVGKTAGLAPLEMLQGIALVDEEWTPASGLVTATQKLNRRVLREHYKAEIEKAFGGK